MRLIILALMISLISSPLWADFGLSNVVTKEIHRVPAAKKTPKDTVFQKGSFYPYTIHISSWKLEEDALKQIEKLRNKLDVLYITKIDLGSSGIWFRVDTGIFGTIKEAALKLKELQGQKIIEKGAFVGSSVPYTIELDDYTDKSEAMQEIQRLEKIGIISYILQESQDYYRIIFGAYPDTNSAETALNDLKALQLSAKISKR